MQVVERNKSHDLHAQDSDEAALLGGADPGIGFCFAVPGAPSHVRSSCGEIG